MCLQNIDKEPKYKDGFGWKVFQYRNDELKPDMQDWKLYEVGEWVKSGLGELIDEITGSPTEDQLYGNGFHIFPRRKDAEAYVEARTGEDSQYSSIRQVEYAQVQATGETALYVNPFGIEEFRSKCIVARKMRILPDNEIGLEYC